MLAGLLRAKRQWMAVEWQGTALAVDADPLPY